VYERVLKGLLGEWEALDKGHKPDPLRIQTKLRLLETLACRCFPHEQLTPEMVDEFLGNDSERELFREICANAVLAPLGENASEGWLFLHLTFEEYLAARGYARRAKAEGWKAIAQVVHCHSWHPMWSEVVVMLVGLLIDPVPFLSLLVDPATDDVNRHRLCLAAKCIIELPATPRRHVKIAPIVERCFLEFQSPSAKLLHQFRHFNSAFLSLDGSLSSFDATRNGGASGSVGGLPTGAEAIQPLEASPKPDIADQCMTILKEWPNYLVSTSTEFLQKACDALTASGYSVELNTLFRGGNSRVKAGIVKAWITKDDTVVGRSGAAANATSLRIIRQLAERSVLPSTLLAVRHLLADEQAANGTADALARASLDDFLATGSESAKDLLEVILSDYSEFDDYDGPPEHSQICFWQLEKELVCDDACKCRIAAELLSYIIESTPISSATLAGLLEFLWGERVQANSNAIAAIEALLSAGWRFFPTMYSTLEVRHVATLAQSQPELGEMR
jgi:hypothetical protein